MKLVALLFYLLTLLACQPPTNFIYTVRNQQGHLIKVEPIYLDERWNTQEVAAIKTAIDNWNVALNNQMRLEIQNDHYKMQQSVDPGLMIIKVWDMDAIAQQNDTLVAYAWTNWPGGTKIFVIHNRPLWDDRAKKSHSWDMRDLQEIIMHEVGHALGSKHFKYRGLMAEAYDREEYLCIDMQAALAVAKYQHIPPTEVRWCEHQSASSSSQ